VTEVTPDTEVTDAGVGDFYPSHVILSLSKANSSQCSSWLSCLRFTVLCIILWNPTFFVRDQWAFYLLRPFSLDVVSTWKGMLTNGAISIKLGFAPCADLMEFDENIPACEVTSCALFFQHQYFLKISMVHSYCTRSRVYTLYFPKQKIWERRDQDQVEHARRQTREQAWSMRPYMYSAFLLFESHPQNFHLSTSPSPARVRGLSHIHVLVLDTQLVLFLALVSPLRPTDKKNSGVVSLSHPLRSTHSPCLAECLCRSGFNGEERL